MEQRTRLNQYERERLVESVQAILGEAFSAPVADVYSSDVIRNWMAYEPSTTTCARQAA